MNNGHVTEFQDITKYEDPKTITQKQMIIRKRKQTTYNLIQFLVITSIYHEFATPCYSLLHCSQSFTSKYAWFQRSRTLSKCTPPINSKQTIFPITSLSEKSNISSEYKQKHEHSRRQWMDRIQNRIITGSLIITTTTLAMPPLPSEPSSFSNENKDNYAYAETNLEPINLTQVAIENSINITLVNKTAKAKVSLDRNKFTKMEIKDTWPFPFPTLFPWLKSQPREIQVIPNYQVFLASTLAGSITSIVRDALLYPLSTMKNRIQARQIQSSQKLISTVTSFNDYNNDTDDVSLKNTANTTVNTSSNTIDYLTLNNDSDPNVFQIFVEELQKPNLYAGLGPSLLGSVPAAGAYFGTRDITNRMLRQAIETPSRRDDLAITLIGAFIADVAALTVRTPVDVLALRKQVATRDLNSTLNTTAFSFVPENEPKEVQDAIGTWWQDSLKQLPVVILTDLPFLLSKISLKKILMTGKENLILVTFETTLIACVCAALTTPFDVVRTRILIDSDNDPTNGLDGGTGGTVLETMINITSEIEGENESKEGMYGSDNVNLSKRRNFQKLFAGWLERTIYLGLGRSWLDPIRLLGYIGIRDTILLEWPFDKT